MTEAAEPLWFYEKDGEEAGPVSEKELLQLLKSGSIYPDTLLWTESMVDWQPALELEPFRSALLEGLSVWTPAPRPWVRFWARRIDLIVYHLLALALMVVGGGQWQDLSGFGFMMLVLWMILLEACLLSVLGTTFGKWLFNISLSTGNGAKPQFGVAAYRTMLLWVRGLALDIPIVGMIAWLIGLRNLSNHGECTWDRDAGTVVRHRKVGPLRWVAAFLIVFSYMATAVLILAPAIEKEMEAQRKVLEQRA